MGKVTIFCWTTWYWKETVNPFSAFHRDHWRPVWLPHILHEEDDFEILCWPFETGRCTQKSSLLLKDSPSCCRCEFSHPCIFMYYLVPFLDTCYRAKTRHVCDGSDAFFQLVKPAVRKLSMLCRYSWFIMKLQTFLYKKNITCMHLE